MRARLAACALATMLILPLGALAQPADQPAPTPDQPADQPEPTPDKPADQPAPTPDKPADQPAPAPDKPAEPHQPAPEKPADQPAPTPDKPADQPEPAHQQSPAAEPHGTSENEAAGRSLHELSPVGFVWWLGTIIDVTSPDTATGTLYRYGYSGHFYGVITGMTVLASLASWVDLGGGIGYELRGVGGSGEDDAAPLMLHVPELSAVLRPHFPIDTKDNRLEVGLHLEGGLAIGVLSLRGEATAGALPYFRPGAYFYGASLNTRLGIGAWLGYTIASLPDAIDGREALGLGGLTIMIQLGYHPSWQ